MAFTVEDGSGVAGANSYVSIADANAYFADRNDSTWAGLQDEVKQKGILDATAYIEAKYRGSWVGSLYDTAQGLSWPRIGAYDPEGRDLDGGVPVDLIAVVCRLALQSATSGDLEVAQDRGGQVKREKVGPIETEYEPGAPAGSTYPYVDDMISGLVRGGGHSLTAELRRT